jgi:hypothetical protein
VAYYTESTVVKNKYLLIKVKVKVKFRIGALQHRSLKAYCALTPKEFLHSSLEALHTERYTDSEGRNYVKGI